MIKRSIFIDCHIFDGGFQGTRTYIQGLYLEMIKNKEIHFFFAACDTDNLKSIFGLDSNITYLKYSSHNKFYRLLIDIPKLIKKHKIEFAHFQYIVPPIKNCKYIVSTHDVLFLDYPEYFPKKFVIQNKILFGWSARKSEIVVTGSKYSKSKIEEHFKINNVFVTVYGIESVFFEPYAKQEVEETVLQKYGFQDYIIYTSRHEPRKNHFRLLQAFIELKLYKKYHLVMIGDVSINDPKFDTLYQSLSPEIQSKISLLNKVSFNDLLLLIRGARLSVYPSIAEGFGLPPLETASARIPTLCSNTTSMGEFTFFGNDFINPLDLDDIKSKISQKLENYDAEYQSNLANFIHEKYCWKSVAKEYFTIIDKF